MSKCTRMVYGLKKTQNILMPKFSRENHQQAIQNSQDVPEQLPDFTIELTEVGISQKTVWISLPFGKMPFDLKITTNLPDSYKGIHMSRIENAISELFNKDFEDIRDYALELAKKISDTQRGKIVKIDVCGKVPVITVSPISKKESIDHIDISAKAMLNEASNKGSIRSKIGLSVTHITACPCTQVYNENLFEVKKNTFPLPTHSQRCVTTLEIEDLENSIGFDDLYSVLTKCLHITQDLLKRPDEAELVLACHQEPQFAEDVIRKVAWQIGKTLSNKMSKDALVLISTVSYESIHLHNVICKLKCKLEDILKAMS